MQVIPHLFKAKWKIELEDTFIAVSEESVQQMLSDIDCQYDGTFVLGSYDLIELTDEGESHRGNKIVSDKQYRVVSISKSDLRTLMQTEVIKRLDDNDMAKISEIMLNKYLDTRFSDDLYNAVYELLKEKGLSNAIAYLKERKK